MVLCQGDLALREAVSGGLAGIVVEHGRSDQLIGKLLYQI